MNAPDKDGWRSLRRHLKTRVHTAPTVFLTLVAALVDGPANIIAAHCTIDEDRSDATTWTGWIVTEHALAVAVLTIDAEAFDGDEESNPMYRSNPPATHVGTAEIRALSNAAVVSIAGASGPRGEDRDQIHVHGLTVTFADQHQIAIPGHDGLYSADEREAIDLLHRTIRRGAGLA